VVSLRSRRIVWWLSLASMGVALACGAGCGAERAREEVMAPKKRTKPIDPAKLPACDDTAKWVTSRPRPAQLAAPTPVGDDIALMRDVAAWNSGACERVATALVPLDRVSDLGRTALRAECDAASAALPANARASCRALCAARRWVDARALGRSRTLDGLHALAKNVDGIFDTIQACAGIPKNHGNSMSDPGVRPLWQCAGLALPPSEVSLTMQFMTEPIQWQEHGSLVTSARAIDFDWMRATSPDENLPWLATFSRCARGTTIEASVIATP
jgi:hypothetical protein